MTLMREYYKNYLSQQGQEIYDLILKNSNGLARYGSIKLSGSYSEQSLHEAAKAYIALRDDRPELYFLDNQVQVIFSYPGILEIKQNIRFTFAQIKRINALLRKKISMILANSAGKDVWYREKDIYKKIATEYIYKDGILSHDVSGLLVYKEGVCESLSGLLVIALRESGIPAIKVRGKARNEPHCWTKVWIEGQPLHLDVTWDMSFSKRFFCYKYFNVTEDMILKDHEIEAPEMSTISRIDDR